MHVLWVEPWSWPVIGTEGMALQGLEVTRHYRELSEANLKGVSGKSINFFSVAAATITALCLTYICSRGQAGEPSD